MDNLYYYDHSPSKHIYLEISARMLESEYYLKDLSEKKVIILNILYNYSLTMIEKMRLPAMTNKNPERKKSDRSAISLRELYRVLGYINQNIRDRYKSAIFFNNYILSLLSIMSSLQRHSISLRCDVEAELRTTTIKYDGDNNIDQIITYQKTSPFHTFQVLMSHFYKKYHPPKQKSSVRLLQLQNKSVDQYKRVANY